MPACRLPLILAGLLVAGFTVSGCVAVGPPGAVQTAAAENFNDPIEDTNRAIFGFNQTIDRNVLVPAAEAYRTLPPPVRHSLPELLQHLNGTATAAHDGVQAPPA